MFLIDRYRKLEGNKRKVVSNVYWALLGKVINMAGALFVGILVARYLGPKNYGLMNYIISYVSIFTVISTFGLDNIEIRELSNNNGAKDKILGTCFAVRFFFSIIALILIVITLYIYKTNAFTTVMILCYSIVLFTSCFNVIRNYFTSIIQNSYIVKTEISRTILGATLKIVLLFFKAPLEYFILATIFDTFLVASGYILSYNKFVGKIKSWRFDISIVPFLIKQSFPLVLSGAAVIIYQRIDQVMIGNMIDTESVGYFATAGKFLDLILFLPTILTQTITPIIVRIKSNNTDEEYRKKTQDFINIIVWVSIIFALLTSLLSYWLIYYSYGNKYLAAVPVLQIMAWKTVGMSLSSSGGQLIIIEKIQKWAVIKNIMGTLACILLNYIFIPKYGIIGSAWVTIITVSISGYLANILIPPYHKIFITETKALFFGWKSFRLIRQLFI